MQKRINSGILQYHGLLYGINLRQIKESTNRVPLKYSEGKDYNEIKRDNGRNKESRCISSEVPKDSIQ
jgi:hypothetical protein